MFKIKLTCAGDLAGIYIVMIAIYGSVGY